MRLSALFLALILLMGALPAAAQDATEGVAATPPAATAGTPGAPPPAFYQTGLRMGTSYCPNVSLNCDSLVSNQSDIVDAANTCINMRFGMDQKIMSSFNSGGGEFENCVMPSAPYTNVRGKHEWAVCCLKRSDNGQCEMDCTRYIDQKN